MRFAFIADEKTVLSVSLMYRSLDANGVPCLGDAPDRAADTIRRMSGMEITARSICSMSRRDNCWDKAIAESFFATLKIEPVTTPRVTRGRRRAGSSE